MNKKEAFIIDWVQHTEYFSIAQENYTEIKKLKKEHDDYQKKLKDKKKILDEDTDFLAYRNDTVAKHTTIVVIFSALSLEAYINHYAINRLSRNYFTTYLDKLDLMSKYIIIPRFVTGKQLDLGSKAVQDLKWLITLRNRLVHYKSKRIAISELKESDSLWDYDAKKAIKTVEILLLALSRIDKKLNGNISQFF